MSLAISPDDPDFFRTAPDVLKFAQVGAEALGMRNAIFAMGDPNAASTPVIIMLSLPPHGVLSRHCHDCHRFEVVIKGSMQDEHGRWLHPGDIRMSEPNEFYGPHRAGPDGVLSAEIFSSASGVNATMPHNLPESEKAQLEHAAKVVEGTVRPMWQRGQGAANRVG